MTRPANSHKHLVIEPQPNSSEMDKANRTIQNDPRVRISRAHNRHDPLAEMNCTHKYQITNHNLLFPALQRIQRNNIPNYQNTKVLFVRLYERLTCVMRPSFTKSG